MGRFETRYLRVAESSLWCGVQTNVVEVDLKEIEMTNRIEIEARNGQ